MKHGHERHVGSHADGAQHHHHGAKKMGPKHEPILGGKIHGDVNRQKGIEDVMQRKGDMEMGQHGRMGSRHKFHH